MSLYSWRGHDGGLKISPMLDCSSIYVVIGGCRPERDALLELLAGLSTEDWARPTECLAWPVKGVATHILGDDLSLLSRQRDGAVEALCTWPMTCRARSFGRSWTPSTTAGWQRLDS
jgi:hypothetical protein